jgi:hypothetical protein
MLRAAAAIFLFLFATVQSRALDMNVQTDKDEKLVYVNMWGGIEPGDDQKFHNLILPYLRTGQIVYQVNIFSQGGDVATAMSLGKRIKMLQTRTVTASNEAKIINNQRVLTNDAICVFQEQAGTGTMIKIVRGYSWCSCESACLLVWAGGITRQGGRIGIHRFYSKGPEFGNLPAQKARELYETRQIEFRDYLKDMNIPATIIDRLFATDSHNMYFLSWPEIQLLDSTPFLEEMVYSKCGKSKHVHMSAANNWTSTEDPQHVYCYRGILKQLMREGAQNYLRWAGVELAAPQPAPAVTGNGNVRRWSHNGSVFEMISNGAAKKFVYLEVREGLREVGVVGGSVAFEGVQTGEALKGKAYVYSARCGQIAYPASGTISADQKRATVSGKAPYVDAQCARVSSRDSTMDFQALD